MICSDLQKYYTIKYNPGLINDGFFKMTRNPNYLGEVLIYNSFAIIVARDEFWVILFYAYFIIFGIRMLIKDYSLSKKKGWAKYDSYMFFPKFSSCWLDNCIIYFFIFALLYSIYFCGGILAFFEESNKILFHADSSTYCEKFFATDLYHYGAMLKEEGVKLVSQYIK